MIKIFALTSGRSGTKYLSGLFNSNIDNCVSKHESYPYMFGKPIYWYQKGEIDKIRKRFKRKKKKIEKYARNKKDVYIETNNAFLKSFSDVAIEAFPDMKLVHLIRNPLEVARSELNKEIWIHTTKIKILYPFPKYYRADGKRYYIWILIGEENIYKDVKIDSITPFQKYVLQWIEIENRAMKFLEKYKKHNDCYTLFTPDDLNNRQIIEDMFSSFNLELKKNGIVLSGDINKNIVPTVVSNDDKKQLREVVNGLPDKYLSIFQKKPYTKVEWAKLLRKNNFNIV